MKHAKNEPEPIKRATAPAKKEQATTSCLSYPITIVMDRYNGVYSGGKWLAFQGNPDEIPLDYSYGDLEAKAFADKPICTYGRGQSPDEALADLERRLT